MQAHHGSASIRRKDERGWGERPIRSGRPAWNMDGMDALTGMPLPLALLVLAIADGFSIGTLLIPLFLLVAPGRVRAGRVLLYLATIALFYLLIGMLFLLGLVNVIDHASAFFSSTAGQIALLVVGAGMLIGAFLMPTGSKRRDEDAPGRLVRWRGRMLAADSSALVVMGVAIAAGVIEIAGMLPYLIGMTMIANETTGLALQYGLLVGYCAVMVAPALLLLAARMLAARLVERPLQRFAGWMQRTGAENTAWLLGIAGFFIARNASTALGIFG